MSQISNIYSSYRKRNIDCVTKQLMVNCEKYPDFREQFGIKTFPSFKILHGVTNRKKLLYDRLTNFTGERSSDNFKNFLQKLGSSTKHMDSYYKLYKKYKTMYLQTLKS